MNSTANKVARIVDEAIRHSVEQGKPITLPSVSHSLSDDVQIEFLTRCSNCATYINSIEFWGTDKHGEQWAVQMKA